MDTRSFLRLIDEAEQAEAQKEANRPVFSDQGAMSDIYTGFLRGAGRAGRALGSFLVDAPLAAVQAGANLVGANGVSRVASDLRRTNAEIDLRQSAVNDAMFPVQSGAGEFVSDVAQFLPGSVIGGGVAGQTGRALGYGVNATRLGRVGGAAAGDAVGGAVLTLPGVNDSLTDQIAPFFGAQGPVLDARVQDPMAQRAIGGAENAALGGLVQGLIEGGGAVMRGVRRSSAAQAPAGSAHEASFAPSEASFAPSEAPATELALPAPSAPPQRLMLTGPQDSIRPPATAADAPDVIYQRGPFEWRPGGPVPGQPEDYVPQTIFDAPYVGPQGSLFDPQTMPIMRAPQPPVPSSEQLRFSFARPPAQTPFDQGDLFRVPDESGQVQLFTEPGILPQVRGPSDRQITEGVSRRAPEPMAPPTPPGRGATAADRQAYKAQTMPNNGRRRVPIYELRDQELDLRAPDTGPSGVTRNMPVAETNRRAVNRGQQRESGEVRYEDPVAVLPSSAERALPVDPRTGYPDLRTVETTAARQEFLSRQAAERAAQEARDARNARRREQRAAARASAQTSTVTEPEAASVDAAAARATSSAPAHDRRRSAVQAAQDVPTDAPPAAAVPEDVTAPVTSRTSSSRDSVRRPKAIEQQLLPTVEKPLAATTVPAVSRQPRSMPAERETASARVTAERSVRNAAAPTQRLSPVLSRRAEEPMPKTLEEGIARARARGEDRFWFDGEYLSLREAEEILALRARQSRQSLERLTPSNDRPRPPGGSAARPSDRAASGSGSPAPRESSSVARAAGNDIATMTGDNWQEAFRGSTENTDATQALRERDSRSLKQFDDATAPISSQENISNLSSLDEGAQAPRADALTANADDDLIEPITGKRLRFDGEEDNIREIANEIHGLNPAATDVLTPSSLSARERLELLSDEGQNGIAARQVAAAIQEMMLRGRAMGFDVPPDVVLRDQIAEAVSNAGFVKEHAEIGAKIERAALDRVLNAADGIDPDAPRAEALLKRVAQRFARDEKGALHLSETAKAMQIAVGRSIASPVAAAASGSAVGFAGGMAASGGDLETGITWALVGAGVGLGSRVIANSVIEQAARSIAKEILPGTPPQISAFKSVYEAAIRVVQHNIDNAAARWSQATSEQGKVIGESLQQIRRAIGTNGQAYEVQQVIARLADAANNTIDAAIASRGLKAPSLWNELTPEKAREMARKIDAQMQRIVSAIEGDEAAARSLNTQEQVAANALRTYYRNARDYAVSRGLQIEDYGNTYVYRSYNLDKIFQNNAMTDRAMAAFERAFRANGHPKPDEAAQKTIEGLRAAHMNGGSGRGLALTGNNKNNQITLTFSKEEMAEQTVASMTRGRTFTNEAARHLDEFRDFSPDRLVNAYAGNLTSKIQVRMTMGPEGKTLQRAVNTLQELGYGREAAHLVSQVASALRLTDEGKAANFNAVITTMTNLALLGRAAISAVTEPITIAGAAARAGDWHGAGRALVGVPQAPVRLLRDALADSQSFGRLVSHGQLSRQQAAEAMEALAIGVSRSDNAQVRALMGEAANPITNVQRLTARLNEAFFRATGNTGMLQQHQRLAFDIFSQTLPKMMKHALDGSAAARRAAQQIGLTEEQMRLARPIAERFANATGAERIALAKHIAEQARRFPDSGEAIFNSALRRMTDRAIQAPHSGQRPAWANGYFRPAYAVQSWAYSYWTNVMRPIGGDLKAVARGRLDDGTQLSAMDRIQLMAPAMALIPLVAATFHVNEARRNVFGGNSAQDRTFTQSALESLSRGSVFPPMTDRLVNALSGARYQSAGQTAATVAGPAYGGILAIADAALNVAADAIGIMPEAQNPRRAEGPSGRIYRLGAQAVDRGVAPMTALAGATVATAGGLAAGAPLPARLAIDAARVAGSATAMFSGSGTMRERLIGEPPARVQKREAEERAAALEAFQRSQTRGIQRIQRPQAPRPNRPSKS